MRKFSIIKSKIRNKRFGNNPKDLLIAEVCCIRRTFKKVETPVFRLAGNLNKEPFQIKNRINLN